MSPLVRTTYFCVFSTLLVYMVYAWWVFQVMGVSYFMGPDALVRIGRSIGSLIVFGHVFEWLVLISALVLGSKLAGKSVSELVVDERDKQINYRSISLSRHVLCIGLFLSMGALAMGWEPFWVFNIIVLFYGIANVVELGAKIFFFRQGIRT